MRDMGLQMRNYRLTTAQILYHMPDHPGLLQEFVWQELDLAPHYPVLHKFLDFWREKLEAKVHSVRVAHAQLIKAAEFRAISAPLVLH